MDLRATIHQNEPPRVVATDADLMRVLSEAAAESRAAGILNIIYLHAPDGNELTLVVGSDETVLGFDYGHGDPPYYASRGSTEEVGIFTAYVSMSHHTEFSRKCVVPFATAEKAAAEFLRTGDLPRSVRWEEV